MRFSGIPAHMTEGFRALKIIELPLTVQPHGIQVDKPEQVEARAGHEPVKVMIGLRALTPGERELVLSAARARAISSGVSGEDIERSAVYNQALALYTVAAATVDPESDRRTPLLFFGDTLEQAAETIRTSPLMTDDIVLYLRERQECFQDEINPQALTVRDSELYDIAKKAAEDGDFLHFMRPALLISLSRTLAITLLASVGDNCGITIASPTNGENSNEKPPKTPRKVSKR